MDSTCTNPLPACLPPCHLQVTGLLQNEGRVQGVTYRTAEGGEEQLAADAVVLATGGFGANMDLLHKYAPQVGHHYCP